MPALTSAQRNWMHYGQDPGGTKYSTLSQINTSNVAQLARAWVLHTGDTGGFFSSSPLAIDNVVYFTSSSGVWAVQGDTGKQLWKYPARNPARRGVSYWQGDAQHPSRILVTVGTTLVALDPKDRNAGCRVWHQRRGADEHRLGLAAGDLQELRHHRRR